MSDSRQMSRLYYVPSVVWSGDLWFIDETLLPSLYVVVHPRHPMFSCSCSRSCKGRKGGRGAPFFLISYLGLEWDGGMGWWVGMVGLDGGGDSELRWDVGWK